MNLDKSPKNLAGDEAFYLLNHERNLNSKDGGRGTLFKSTPMPANYLACEMDQPAGENYAPNSYYSPLTNETYSFVYNSNGVHYIQRIDGSGNCDVIYHGCLNISAEPRHSIEQFRAYLLLDKLCANRHGKTLVWTDGLNDVGAIDVEASLATKNFTTNFFNLCSDPCDFIRLAVPDPCGCMTGSFVPLPDTERSKSNNITDTGFKFCFRWVYYDGRASIYSEPTTLFYQDTRGCFENAEGLPRCIKLRVPVGNAMVEKIELLFWKDGNWFLYDTIEKYKKYTSSQQYWYERELSEEVEDTFSTEDCSFDYLFCNDKQCEAVDANEVARVYNPVPREAQGILPIGLSNQEDVALAFYNYIQGNCPIDKFEVDKFDVGLNCDTDSCQPKLTKITFYAVVHNRVHNTNQPIFRLQGAASNAADDDSDTAYFGGINNRGSGDLELGHGQSFSGKTRNFIAYVEGSSYWDEAEQWKADPLFLNKEKWGTLGGFDKAIERNRWRRAIDGGQFFYQKFEITVPQGTRGFLRLASHESTGNDQDKSTFVIGIFNDINNYQGTIAIHSGNTDLATEEIYFDTCNQTELEIQKAFVIDDNAIDAGLTSASSSYRGYVKDANGLPLEGVIVELKDGTFVEASSKTDHNGFYHFYRYPGRDDSFELIARAEKSCSVFSEVFTGSITAEKHYFATQDISVTDEQYKTDFYANVTALVKDCYGFGVSGVRVALSGSKYKTTGVDGVARFRVRNYDTRDRNFIAVALNYNGCFISDCNNGCDPCMPIANGSAVSCYQGIPTIATNGMTVNIESALAGRNGLKSGGRYGFGFFVRGRGRISAVYPIKYLDIPRTQEKNKYGFCEFTFSGNNINLPAWAECLYIVRTPNQNPFELQWLVDEIERTDDGKIKLTIQSLNDYNEQYFFKTNTVYQWAKGDRVEFIRNGDGTIFTIADHGLLNYLTLSPHHDEQISGQTEAEADFFNQILINDDGKLDSLEKGALIELQRIKECNTDPVYYGICASIPVVNGQLVVSSGTFHTFDTYYVNRKIGEFPAQQFEHHNPSDFWGDYINRLTDAGRGYFVNQYENEKRYGRNLTINSPNEFNRFGDLVKRLNPSIHGDITAMWVTDNKIGLCISEFDNSIFEIGDSLLRVGNDDIVRTTPSDQVISDSQSKLSGAFGCQYDSIGSVFFGDGFATWIDVNRHSLIKHDYNVAKMIDKNKAQRYFRRKCQEIESFNKSVSNPLDKFRFTTGMNYANDAINLTIKKLRDSGVNNEPAPFMKPNETIVFDPVTEDILTFAGFTPESYSRLDLFDGTGCRFLAFFNGLPYIHPIVSDRWNEFFGVACDWMVGVAMNLGPEKIKVPLSYEVQSDIIWYVKSVTTDDPSFRSEVPPRRVRKTEYKCEAEFLGNSNSRYGLYGDLKARGYYAEVLFVRDNSDGLKYNTVDNLKRIQYSELDQIIFKFMVSEQSGVTENL